MKGINKRLLFSFIVACLISVILIFKLLYIQVWEHTKFYSLANRQLKSEEVNLYNRGTIYDCNKNVLAVSSVVDSLAVNPKMIKNKSDFVRRLLSVLEVDYNEILGKVSKSCSFVWIKRYLDPEKSRRLRELNLEGMNFVKENRRWYPYGTMACHLLGGVGIDGNGLSGIEYLYDRELSNRDEYADKLGSPADKLDRLRRPADIILCIDINLQSIVEDELDILVKQYKSKKAFIVIQRPSTGEILALAARPNFNSNSYNFTQEELLNPVINGVFEPGSTYKIVPAAAALSLNIMKPDNLINCENGKYKFSSITINDHKKYNYLTFEGVMAYSSNIGIAKIGLTIGKEKLYQYSQKFGFGSLTGSGLPGEQEGILHHTQSRKWSKVTAPVMSYGQGVCVTGMQLINAYSSIANGGMLMEPQIIKSKPRIIRQVVSEKTAEELKKMLSKVVEYGTGTKSKVDGYTVCGKTGTAQKIDPVTGKYSKDKYISSFCGFLPADKPELTILVVVDEPKGCYWGSEVACPSFSRVAKKAMNYYSIYEKRKLDYASIE